MQQTISINLAGMVFHIEKDAYDQLEKYLEQIKNFLANNESREEIIQDIENRVAEIFQEQLSSRKEALAPEDVQAVKKALGEPETFKSENSQEGKEEGEGKKQETYTRKGQIHRDVDNKVIAGVCSGLGQYFGFDPLWLRLAFVVAIFASGISILIYLILWLLTPAAKTPVQKMEMRGERVTVSNIEKSFAGEQGSKKNSNEDSENDRFRVEWNSFAEKGKGALKTGLDALENGFYRLGHACRRATTKL